MEYREVAEDRLFREEVREWLHANKPHEPRPDTVSEQMAYDRAWQAAQYEGGWAGISWPKEYGGRGLTPTQQLIWCEEYARAGCPTVHDSCWLGLNHAGPTLIVRGTEDQKSYHLPRILKGESTWCQGFSEPNAGSDLASLRTRAVVDGDHLVVNGQKIWTTLGHLADYQELLVRTGPLDGRHRGLTWVICDMRTPGIDVRPITALDGKLHNCEVFYDDVRIPLTNVVGEINDGWSVAMTTFGFERGPAAFSTACEIEVMLEELVKLSHHLPGSQWGTPAIEDSAIAERLGELRARAQSVHAMMHMMTAAAEINADVGAESSIMHLAYTELYQAVARCAIDVIGARSLGRTAVDSWVANYLNTFGATLAGGTSEIQRNIIGERLLGLPR